ncbi:hypothetical protein, partial [Bordetella pertussis]
RCTHLQTQPGRIQPIDSSQLAPSAWACGAAAGGCDWARTGCAAARARAAAHAAPSRVSENAECRSMVDL